MFAQPVASVVLVKIGGRRERSCRALQVVEEGVAVRAVGQEMIDDHGLKWPQLFHRSPQFVVDHWAFALVAEKECVRESVLT